jgi:hypothetical protein
MRPMARNGNVAATSRMRIELGAASSRLPASRPPSHFRDPGTRHPAGKFWLAACGAHEPVDSDHFLHRNGRAWREFFYLLGVRGIGLRCSGGLADLFFGLRAVGESELRASGPVVDPQTS